MIRIVADTNVLVSGILVEHGASARILEAVRSGGIMLIMSPALLAEFEIVIQRAHIAKKYPVAQEKAHDFVLFLTAHVEIVEGKVTRPGLVVADSKDDIVMACALEGKAEFIVSGDQHLTDLKEVDGIQILKPAEFVRQTGIQDL